VKYSDKSTKVWYVCGYELETNLQNFMQKDLIEVKIFQKVFFLGGATFLKHHVGSRTWVFQRTQYWTPKIQDGGDTPS